MELTSPKLSTLNSNDLADAVADTVSRYGGSLRAEFGWMDELSDSSLVVELGKRAVEGTLSENAEAYIWPRCLDHLDDSCCSLRGTCGSTRR